MWAACVDSCAVRTPALWATIMASRLTCDDSVHKYGEGRGFKTRALNCNRKQVSIHQVEIDHRLEHEWG